MCLKRNHKTRAEEPEPGVFGPLEPEQNKKRQEQEPLLKKLGAGAAKNMR